MDDVQRLPVGPRLHATPRSSARWPRRCSSWPRAGVDVLRLDAVPFLWKRKGTNCQNQPEVHELLQAFRAADAHRGAGGRLQGRGDRLPARPRGLPRRRAPRGQGVRPRLPQRPHGPGVERARLGPRRAADQTPCARCRRSRRARAGSPTCAATTTSAGPSPRRTPGPSARTPTCTGASWPTSTPATSPPASRAARASSPTRAPARRARAAPTASLAGLEAALESGDELALELALRRILLLYAVAFAHGGLPLIYMGDELGLRNDHAWEADPARREDNRWMHRPPMDWTAAERRADPASVEGRLWDGLRRLVAARRATRAAHAQGAAEPLWTGNDHVFGLLREQAGERLLLLANFTPERQPVDLRRGPRPRARAHRRRPRAPDGRPAGAGGRPRRPRALPVPLAARLTQSNIPGVEVSRRPADVEGERSLMRTRTDTLVFRLGFTLAVLVLAAFLALVGAIVCACVDRRRAAPSAGPPASCSASSWPRSRAAAAARSSAASSPRLAQLRPAASSCWYFSVMWATAWFCCSAMPGRVSVARALASSVDCAWPWKSGMTCWAMSS